jgi:hypothetical protein
MARKPPSFEEQVELYAKWDPGSFATVEQSISYHHVKHGRGMTRWEYLQKAAAFQRQGALKTMARDHEKYFHPTGEFLIENNGKIVSYGPPRD